MRKIALIFLLGLALNAFGEGPLNHVDIQVETFKQTGEESGVFYQDNEIGAKITVINNSSTDLRLEVNYQLDAADGDFKVIKGPQTISVAAKELYIITDSFTVPPEIVSGTFIVKANAKEAILGSGDTVTGNSFITIFSGSGDSAPTSVDETSLFLLPITGFMALFLLRKKHSF